MNSTNGYRDIIGLPHPVSAVRKQMPRHDRAAQFSPFAALTGYEEIIGETARLTDERAELSEERQTRINERLLLILENISERPEVKITYFVPDKRKNGGAYETAEGRVRRVDECFGSVIFADHRAVPIADIYDIEGVLFGDTADGAPSPAARLHAET